QVRAFEIGLAQPGHFQVGCLQLDVVQLGAGEPGEFQIGGAHVGAFELRRLGEQGPAADGNQIGAGQVGQAQVALLQAGAGQVGAAQLGFFQIGQVAVDVAQVCAGQVGPGQVHAAHVEVAQVGATQVGVGAFAVGFGAAAVGRRHAVVLCCGADGMAAEYQQQGRDKQGQVVHGESSNGMMGEAVAANRPLKNVGEAASARQKQAKKRSLRAVNEHFEPVFNAAM